MNIFGGTEMLASVSNFIRTLKEKKVVFTHFPPEGDRKTEAVKISYSAKHGNELNIIFFFDPEGGSVNIKVFEICKPDEEKLMNMYVAINELNNSYRWIKLYLDDDNEVTASGDAIINEDTAGEECFEILIRYLSILDEAYPTLMKAMWA